MLVDPNSSYDKVFVFFTFARKNVFINIFVERQKQRFPILSRSLHWYKAEEKVGKNELHEELLDEFICITATWIRDNFSRRPRMVIVSLKEYGRRFKFRRQTHRGISKN
jgi:hypothetical protein